MLIQYTNILSPFHFRERVRHSDSSITLKQALFAWDELKIKNNTERSKGNIPHRIVGETLSVKRVLCPSSHPRQLVDLNCGGVERGPRLDYGNNLWPANRFGQKVRLYRSIVLCTVRAKEYQRRNSIIGHPLFSFFSNTWPFWDHYCVSTSENDFILFAYPFLIAFSIDRKTRIARSQQIVLVSKMITFN